MEKVLCRVTHYPDGLSLTQRLKERGERPRSCRSTEKSDEIAPFIKPSPKPQGHTLCSAR
jgi:hypothetical protein